MFELPLFPLNTVLFPGMPLPLHIFEERYKLMISQCLQGERIFGVVQIKHGSEALGPLAEPHLVGCTARIIELETLDEGRLQIDTVGEQRFQVLKLKNSLPYLVGEVDQMPIEAGSPEELKPGAERLTTKVRQYIDLLNQIENVELDSGQIPQDPLALAYFASALLQMPPTDKQKLLESGRGIDLINYTNQFYLREIAFLRAIIERGQDQSKTPVSQN